MSCFENKRLKHTCQIEQELSTVQKANLGLARAILRHEAEPPQGQDRDQYVLDLLETQDLSTYRLWVALGTYPLKLYGSTGWLELPTICDKCANGPQKRCSMFQETKCRGWARSHKFFKAKPELPTDQDSPCQAICHGHCEMNNVEDCEQWDDWRYKGVTFTAEAAGGDR